MSYIVIEQLTYRYPESDRIALEHINLTVEQGEVLFLVGRSGCGKSTLAKCITGAVPQFYGGTIGGEVRIHDKPIESCTRSELAKEITMVFQDPERQLLMNKVHREVAFGLENIGMEESLMKRRVWEALQFTGVMDLAFRDIQTLSGGQKQKIAIASALAYMPKCIILDEPTSQLDPTAAEEIAAIIKKVNEELGITIIIIEQRIDKWFDIADRIAVMEKGKLVFCGAREELYQHSGKTLHQFLPTYMKVAKLLQVEKPPMSFSEARKKMKTEVIQVSMEDTLREAEERVVIKRLRYSYDAKVEALKNLDMKIYKKDFIGILGANGAGKSTFLKALMGLIPYEGSIQIFNKEVKKTSLRERVRDIAYVSQNPNDYLSKDTVYEEIKFTLDNYGVEDAPGIEAVMERLRINHLRDRNPRDASGGERQRIAIASMLVLKPKILLLDEPTRGLDGKAKFELGALLKEMNAAGTTILLITHDIEFAAEYCSRFMLMFNGEVMSMGTRSEVLGQGIYYTTAVHKLFGEENKKLFTVSQIRGARGIYEEN